jgi:hypothetical protein
LPAISGALLLTAAQVTVLFFVVRPERPVPVETMGALLLPQNPRPPEPMVIDARRPAPQPVPQQAAAPPTPAPVANAPAQSATAPQGTAITAPAPATTACPDEAAGKPAQTGCPQLTEKPDPDRLVIAPPPRVKNQDIWEEDLARKNAPFALPGADGGIVGIIGTLIFNPSAYLDKKSYAYGVRPAAAPPPPGRVRPTEEEFKKALAAANRQRGVKEPAASARAPQ